MKQETTAFVADASPNRKQFPAAQWDWILAIILHSWRESDFMNVIWLVWKTS